MGSCFISVLQTGQDLGISVGDSSVCCDSFSPFLVTLTSEPSRNVPGVDVPDPVCASDPLRDSGGVMAEVCETVDPLRDVFGVTASSCTAEEIRFDAELRKDDPKPKIFPETPG